MHASFNLFLVTTLFSLLQFLLFCKKLLVPIKTSFSQIVSSFTGKPPSDHALYVQSCLLAIAHPHGARVVTSRENNLIVSSVDEKARFLHLGSLLAHHVS